MVSQRSPHEAHDHEQRVAFVQWYGMPDSHRVPKTRKEYSELCGIPDRTLYSWEQSQWFKDDIQRLYNIVNLSPRRIQEVVDAMHSAAALGSTQAASLYLQYIERLSPTKTVVESKQVNEMSDEELKEALLKAAQ